MSTTDSIEQEKLDANCDANESGDSGEETNERGNWTGKCDFFMSCLSYAVGLGNLWRFPYLCFKNGGGAFLIPYCTMMVFAGMPLFFLELSFGQFAGTGIINVWEVCPLFKGVGFGMFLVSCMIGTYYTMVIAWSFFYTFASFASDVPWRHCNNPWNTAACSQPQQYRNCSAQNGTWYNQTCWTVSEHGKDVYDTYYNISNSTGRRSASYEYFHRRVLAISDNLDDIGYPRWDIVLCLLLSWLVVFLCLIRGVKSSGKVVYFTALFPYVVLIILLGRAVTLPGAVDGISYYLNPNFTKLATPNIWGDAAVQIFFSLSPCWGGLITLASYNKFNNNALRDSIVVTLSNCGTSFFAGFVIFAIIGFMAKQLNIKIEDAAVQGAGLAFVAYPEVVAQLPISPLWSILFFLMLITLGMGTQMTTINTVYTTILDLFSNQLRQGHRPKLVLAVICTVGFLMGLTMTCNGGMYMLQIMDNYSGTYSTLIIGLTECVALSWVYGWERLSIDIKLMLGRRPSLWWRGLWQFVTPGIVAFIMIFTFVGFKRSDYNKTVLPVWADGMGWCISMFCVLPVIVFAIVAIVSKYSGDVTLCQALKLSIKPTSQWKPADPKVAITYSNNVRLRSRHSGEERGADSIPLSETV